MVIKYSKVKKSNKNVAIKTLPLSAASSGGEVVTSQNNGLEVPFNIDNEFSDEEWLKAKHRILDGRMEYRNLMKTINNAKSHL